MLDAIQDRLRKGTVISAKLIIPAIGIILGAEDGRGSPASPMEKLQNVMLFGFSWFQQEPFINDQQDRVGIFTLDFLVCVYISEELTIPHGQSDHLSRRFRSLISERDSR